MIFRHLVLFSLVLTLSPYTSLANTTLDAIFANGDYFNQPLNRVCLGDGTGGFACSDVSAGSNDSNGVALGDVNGDAFLDAVFAEFHLIRHPAPIPPVTAGSSNRVCLGDGTGRFTCSDVSADRDISRGVALGDVNDDPFLDAVFANSGGQPSRVCLGDGTGNFTCSDVGADTDFSLGVALGDVNGDTFLDAVFANEGFGVQANQVCLGDGTGGFVCSDVSADSNYSRGVALGEVDKAAVIDPAPIPILSLWTWFLLSALLIGMAMIMLRIIL